MKYIIYLLTLQFFLLSCNNSKTEKNKIHNLKEISQKQNGNLKTEERFLNFKKKLIVEDDSLRDTNFFNQKFKEVKCKCKFISENDFENQTENYFIREYSIMISDSIEIKVLQKQEKISDYIYTYKNKLFKVKNFYGEMFSKNSDLFFTFENRKCYRISKNQFLMREQPMMWSGLANQFDVFQIINLDKLEMLQFVDKDNKLN